MIHDADLRKLDEEIAVLEAYTTKGRQEQIRKQKILAIKKEYRDKLNRVLAYPPSELCTPFDRIK